MQLRQQQDQSQGPAQLTHPGLQHHQQQGGRQDHGMTQPLEPGVGVPPHLKPDRQGKPGCHKGRHHIGLLEDAVRAIGPGVVAYPVARYQQVVLHQAEQRLYGYRPQQQVEQAIPHLTVQSPLIETSEKQQAGKQPQQAGDGIVLELEARIGHGQQQQQGPQPQDRQQRRDHQPLAEGDLPQSQRHHQAREYPAPGVEGQIEPGPARVVHKKVHAQQPIEDAEQAEDPCCCPHRP
ncbi:hypothetical protein D3C87_1293540 [compost metagenome]